MSELSPVVQRIIAALKGNPCTADELSRRVSYIEFSDRDICERIRFKSNHVLKDVYYLKADEKVALRQYIKANERTILKLVANGESGIFPPKLVSCIDEYIRGRITTLEYESDVLRDEIDDNERGIQKCEQMVGKL